MYVCNVAGNKLTGISKPVNINVSIVSNSANGEITQSHESDSMRMNWLSVGEAQFVSGAGQGVEILW